jgi:hypothetical protein
MILEIAVGVPLVPAGAALAPRLQRDRRGIAKRYESSPVTRRSNAQIAGVLPIDLPELRLKRRRT